MVNIPHATHKLHQTQVFELDFIDRYTARPETIKKAKSTARHQVGAPLQHELEQACATNRNGVAKQWIMQKKLAAAPIESGLKVNDAILKYSRTKLRGRSHTATKSRYF
jgi:hypothetical protein